ncbi:MAG TPA: adenosylcobinamide amidohydrolase [Candidatus Binataceae bacterium]|nr:adenosylcobinamide amidohydrolase [Candidatus Binataceae bacterium]
MASHTLVIKLPVRYRALGWAPMGGGLKRASAIINHQIARDDRVATEAPVPYLSRLAISLGFRPRDCIAMMTGANVNRGGRATMRRRGLAVSGWCTAGCSNALRVGDRATASSSPPGTINIAVVINRPVTIAALAEGLQVAVEARILAVQETGLKSIRSGLPATGTGTDCIVVAAPEPEMKAPGDVISYCGKHTVLGELIGRTVMRACTIALNRQAGSA